MESETTVNDDSITTWSSATNWTTIRGTLVNSITFESSFSPSPLDDETGDLNSTAKRRPLILKPTAPDSSPCEITISFAQKQELGQIYVKSTARVYEIYCSSDLQSEKEYLCTVRCGAAATDDDDDDDDDDNDGARSGYSNESRDNPSKENSGEDEWIEVKAPDSSLTLIKPEFYEATAQMSDVNPCISVTIRLLSVQSKDVVFIDEVYVFADMVDLTIDSTSQAGQVENSNGNSLMAMLMPTLLEMSKAKGSTGRQDNNNALETWKKPNFHGSASDAACSSSTRVEPRVQKDDSSSTNNNQKVECQMNTGGKDATELPGHPKVSLGESKAADHFTVHHVGKGLDQLFSRMGRMEELFLRLEENLLKPINSIEARLDRVEQQLEVLANKQKNSELPSCLRFCAPNFSSVQSESNSFYRSEIEYPRFEEFETAKSFHSDLQTNQADDVSERVNVTDNANVTQMLPGLVVTAPEFSNCDDDEEEDEGSERVTETSVEEARRPLTVDDALASALAGLVSSISIQPQNHTPALSVKAPEFPNEEDTDANGNDSPRGQPDTGTDETSSENGSLSNAPQSEKTTEEVGVQSKHYEEGHEDNSSRKSIDENEDVRNEELSVEFVLNQTVDPEQEDDKICPVSSCAVGTSKGSSEAKELEALQEILGLSQSAHSVVDFESPVLDVEFLSRDSCSRSFSLEALLSSDSDLPETESGEATCAKESHDTALCADEQRQLILVEHCEPPGPAFSSQIFVDFNYCSLQEQEPMSTEDETPQLASNSNTFLCSHENFPSSLI